MRGGITIDAQGTIFLDGHELHPAQGALQAAADDIEQMLDDVEADDVLVLAGLGLGWHAAAAKALPKPPSVLVYEPDATVGALQTCLGPDLADVDIASDAGQLAEKLGHLAVYGGSRRITSYSAPAYRRQRPHLLDTVRRLVADAVDRREVDQATRHKLWRVWVGHLAANMKQLLAAPDLTRLAGAFQGAPALVVGAGPSLDQSLEAIRQARRQGVLILAAASALRPLAQVGVAPDVAVALEAKDESRQFTGVPNRERILLALASHAHPNHFLVWPERKGVFHLQDWLPGVFGGGLALPTGGHATSAGFSLAVLWGCDPIVLIGQDLAYTGGRVHAAGRPGGEEDRREETVPVRGIDGGTVHTSAVMHSYLQWYAESAAYLRRSKPGLRLFNATAGGAAIAGFEHVHTAQLYDIIGNEDAFQAPDWSLLDGMPRIAPAGVARRLDAERGLVRRGLQGLSRSGLGRTLEELPQTCAARWLLREALAGGSPEEMEEAMLAMFGLLRDMREAADAI